MIPAKQFVLLHTSGTFGTNQPLRPEFEMRKIQCTHPFPISGHACRCSFDFTMEEVVNCAVIGSMSTCFGKQSQSEELSLAYCHL
jgi:hypothetical protein